MLFKYVIGVALLSVGLCATAVFADTPPPEDSNRIIKSAVLTTTEGQTAAPVSEVQWRRYYRGSYGYPRYRSYPYSYTIPYGRYYNYRPYYGYTYPRYNRYYSSYPYGYNYYGSYPRYYRGYGGGLSIYGPRIGASFYW